MHRLLTPLLFGLAVLSGTSPVAIAAVWDPNGPLIQAFFTDPLHGKGGGVDESLVKLIDSAKVRVDAHFFQLQREPVVAALIRAQKRLGSCKVRLMTDATYLNEPGYAQVYERLQRVGIPIVTEECAGLADSDLFSHHKYVVVDRNVVWTGSYNVTEHATIAFHENGVIVRSHSLAKAYLAQYAQQWGDDPDKESDDCKPGCGQGSSFGRLKSGYSNHTHNVGGSRVEVYFTPGDDGVGTIVDNINSATQGVYFAIFAFTRTEIAGAMLNRANAGLPVQGVYDDMQADASNSTYYSLEGVADVKRHAMVTPHAALLHHKFVVMDPFGDDPRVITGSYNFSVSAETRNDENFLVIHDRRIAQEYYCEVYRLYYGQTCPPPTTAPSVPTSSALVKPAGLSKAPSNR